MAVPGATLKFDPFQGAVFDLRFASDDRWLTPLEDSDAPGPDRPAPGAWSVAGRAEGPFLRPGDAASQGIPWIVEELVQTRNAVAGRFTLGCRPKGARVERELCLHGNVPLLYQSHWLSGGRGRFPVTHPAFLRLSGGDLLCLSPKRPGAIARGADGRERDLDLAEFATGEGAIQLDPFDLPGGAATCIRCVEATGQALAWTAVMRAGPQDIVFLLKDATSLPVTMFSVSAGARDDPAASRRNRMLGLTDARCPSRKGGGHGAGHLELAPDRCHMIRHVIGAIPRPAAWRSVRDIHLDEASLIIHGDRGAPVVLPFEPEFFAA